MRKKWVAIREHPRDAWTKEPENGHSEEDIALFRIVRHIVTLLLLLLD